MTNLPSDAIAKNAATDEFGKDMKGKNIVVIPFPSSSKVIDQLWAMFDNGGCRKVVKEENLKIEKDGSVSINIKLPDGGAPGIVPAWGNYDPELETMKVVRFLTAPMSTEFPGEDNKEMVVKVVNLPPEIENKDMVIVLEDRQLAIELNTVLKEYGKIKKVAELPAGVTGRGISILMDDRVLTVTVALEKPEPEKKPKSIISKIKGFLAKACPACLAVGVKMVIDAITD